MLRRRAAALLALLCSRARCAACSRRGGARAAGDAPLLGAGREGEVRAAAHAASSSASTRTSDVECSRSRGPRRTRSCSPPSSATPRPTSRSSATPGCPSSRRSMRSSRSTLRRAVRHREIRATYFPGHLGAPTSSTARSTAIPWYVDTRVLFYRTDLLAAAGYDSMPQPWAAWREAMEEIKRRWRARASGRSFCRRTSGRSR